MKPLKLSGLVAAAHTPFKTDGSLHLDIVEKQAEHLLLQRLALVFIGGSTGESHSLNLEERRQLAQRWMEVTRGTALRVIVHVGSNCLVDAAALAAHAQQLGALAISALAPSYFKPGSVSALVDCCAQIASAAPQMPFYFYDIPALTGVNFHMPEFLDRARDRIPTLAGLKCTSSDMVMLQESLRVADGAFDILWGNDECLLAALALGVPGAVGSTYNFAAPLYHRLLAAFHKGDLAAARQEQFRSVRLVRLLSRHGYLGAAKALMGMLGVEVGPARLPNGNPPDLGQLRRDLDQLGFFGWVSPGTD